VTGYDANEKKDGCLIASDSLIDPCQEAVSDSMDDDLLLVEQTALKQLVIIVEKHAHLCSNQLCHDITRVTGHVSTVSLKCSAGHSYQWKTSTYLSNMKYVVNCRMVHAFVSSGIIPATYKRLCGAAGIGFIRHEERQTLSQTYAVAVDEEYEESLEEALVMETAMGDVEEGISLMSDARHGWRKNAKDTSVVVIGDTSHKVIRHEHITKKDDPITQRHEHLGTERALNKLKDKNVNINIWTHDRNTSINVLLRKSGEDITCQNDSWHGMKGLKRDITVVTSGAKKRENITWHSQLFDKKDGVATHVHYALRSCNGDGDLLRAKMDNAVEHYKNNHNNCDPKSRCKTDKNYKPSKLVITSPKAEKLLCDAIHKTTIYKYAEDFSHGKDTHYVESFNNTLHIFQDKRICFSDYQYDMCAKLATIHWNTNVDRAYTSVWIKPTLSSNKRGKLKKNYKMLDYSYRQNIWKKFIQVMLRE
jgi:hypothetical protein